MGSEVRLHGFHIVEFIYLFFLVGASWVAQLVKNLPAIQDILVRFLGQEVPLEKG